MTRHIRSNVFGWKIGAALAGAATWALALFGMISAAFAPHHNLKDKKYSTEKWQSPSAIQALRNKKRRRKADL